MKKIILIITLIIFYSCNQDNEKRIKNLKDSILIEYSEMLIKETELGSSKNSKDFNSIMNKILKLRNLEGNSYKIDILEFQVLYLFKKHDKAIEKINQLDNNENEIRRALYQGVFYELENDIELSQKKYDKVYDLMTEIGISDFNCHNYNIVIILAKKNKTEFEDCNSSPNLTEEYYENLLRKKRKDLIFELFLYRAEI
jgi:hypothetical protein